MVNKIVVATSTFTRPNTTVPFKKDFPEMPGETFKKYVQSVYIDTGKILSRTTTISEDQLTMTSVTVWANNEEREKYIENFIVKKHFEHTINYCKESNIKFDWKNQEYDGNEIVREWSGTF